MGLYQFKPPASGRMGTLWTLAPVRGASLLEYGCMGHMLYARTFLERAGIPINCRLHSTHLDETDIALGGADRLHAAVSEIILQDAPQVLFLLPSSVPEIIGTDLSALCSELQPKYPNTLLLPFGQGGFKSLSHQGVQDALMRLVKFLPRKTEKTSLPTFNIIGSCADLFRFQADAQEITRVMQGTFDMQPLCVLTSDTSVEKTREMGGAHINLVLRREGAPAAKQLQKQFGTPYLPGRPYGIRGTLQWIQSIAELLHILPDRRFLDSQKAESDRILGSALPMLRYRVRQSAEKMLLSVGGHADVVRGVLDYGCSELSLPRGTCWCDCPDMADGEISYLTEEQWTGAIQKQKGGLLMASGEALTFAGHGDTLQISNPDSRWRLNPYEPPFVGFRGALHLLDLWVNKSFQDQE